MGQLKSERQFLSRALWRKINFNVIIKKIHHFLKIFRINFIYDYVYDYGQKTFLFFFATEKIKSCINKTLIWHDNDFIALNGQT